MVEKALSMQLSMLTDYDKFTCISVRKTIIPSYNFVFLDDLKIFCIATGKMLKSLTISFKDMAKFWSTQQSN